ncbi:double-stranded RNA-binding protein Staufen homolog 2-like isoform X1 [Acipenser ruthenus]|uniref:double-stranded RNA-binding protein Staufen homolog 2-like isoform X1 n=1 Tax=Acipenser ruthenus TaxID=7906 RepID=UPI0027428E10|nr:double-stranded RNA-binding protein Staufen homolog 2-like isoform X1 [Acipenser ruthenus]
MAQVKVQTTANLSGSAMSPAVQPPTVPSACPLGLQSSMNRSVPASSTSCSSPAAGLVDSTVSANSPASPQENMANPKEKTPMCLVNELGRFNRIQSHYKLLNEQGAAHAKIFTVQLTLGEQIWEAEGSSIKKAQHSAAAMALTETTLPKPSLRPPKVETNSNPGSITPTVELNGLAMKRGEPAIYRPLDPKPLPNYKANYNFQGMFNQRYHYPVPKIFYVQLTVGTSEFIGEGRTRQAARHNAAMKALQALRNEPIPEKPPQSIEGKNEAEEESDASKSEISLVFEIALKRNVPVSFEVIKECGPPHMKSFVTRVTVGDFAAEGEGNSKKLSKKRAAIMVLQELNKLPFLPVREKPKLHYKKRPKTILKTGPEYGQGMNPISRLAQIQQAKKEKEPEYTLLSERGMPRRREFIMQVKVVNESATGTGPNKKVAKRNSAEAMLLQLGYKASTPAHSQAGTPVENKGWNGQKVAFPELTSNTQKGILHLSPDVYQEMEASRNKTGPATAVNYLNPKDIGQGSSSFFSTTNNTATIARELLLNGISPTAEAIGVKGKAPASPCTSVQPSQQLENLARIQGFQVQYNDRPNGKECMTYLSLSPVQMTFHGIGSSIAASHDKAALSALKQLSEQGLDPVEGAMKVENGPCDRQLKHLGEKADNKQTNSGTTGQACKDSKAIV